jgi:hypothetical protein
MPKFKVNLEIKTSIEIDADSAEEAARQAKDFVRQLEPTELYIDGWNMFANNWVSFFEDFTFGDVSAEAMPEEEDA